MRVSEVMTPDVRTIGPQTTLREAAKLMADLDVGALPVAQGDRLVGILTDRDIVVRAVCAGKTPDTTVGEAMSCEIKYCFEDQDIEEVAENMGQIQLRRLPVVNRDKRLVGIVSLADITAVGEADEAGEALRGITRPGGQHSQSADGRI